MAVTGVAIMTAYQVSRALRLVCAALGAVPRDPPALLPGEYGFCDPPDLRPGEAVVYASCAPDGSEAVVLTRLGQTIHVYYRPSPEATWWMGRA